MSNRYVAILLAFALVLLSLFLLMDVHQSQNAKKHIAEQETVQMR